jgi:hypothetical protein
MLAPLAMVTSPGLNCRPFCEMTDEDCARAAAMDPQAMAAATKIRAVRSGLMVNRILTPRAVAGRDGPEQFRVQPPKVPPRG